MLKILINSYTCCPEMGSEQGMGWNWIINLARYCELYVISEGEYRSQVEAASAWDCGDAEVNEYGLTREQCQNLHFFWIPIGGNDAALCDKVRKMCWNQGDWRFYIYYKTWQQQVADKAREICDQVRIDVLHQLNMIGFREPGFLWQVSRETGIPFVWGPIDAKEGFPINYAQESTIQTKVFLWLKNRITRWQLSHDKRVRAAAQTASVVVSSTSNSVYAFRKYQHMETVLLNETGCHVHDIPVVDKSQKQRFDMLWVGKLDFRKQLSLALRIVARMKRKDVFLHVVGGTLEEEEPYKQKAHELGIDQQIVWHEKVPHKTVQVLMRKSDVLLFTSVAEGTPHVVLESIANNLPVVCFDTCGHGDSVNEKVGVKIPLSNPRQSVEDFASALDRLYANRSLLSEMSSQCVARQRELSWDSKIRAMVDLYEKAVDGKVTDPKNANLSN